MIVGLAVDVVSEAIEKVMAHLAPEATGMMCVILCTFFKSVKLFFFSFFRRHPIFYANVP
jgi:hypothetical protein